MRHFLTLENMTIEWWESLYRRFNEIYSNPREWSHSLEGQVMASLFYEPSSRTQFSFQAAMTRLGGSVFGFSDPMTSSVAKGESLADTVRVVTSFADVLVIRSNVAGAADEAAKWSFSPVINAGDGGHMHPTQTLADLTALTMRLGEIRDLHVGLCGDLKYGRTVHSLVYALSKFPGIRFTLISPKGLSMPDYIIDYMNVNHIKYDVTESFEETLPSLDILYMTRVQKERFTELAEYERYSGVYVLTAEKLKTAKADMLVMHPLPRVDEIAVDIDSDPRSIYFEQVKYGMYIRMALLTDLLSG